MSYKLLTLVKLYRHEAIGKFYKHRTVEEVYNVAVLY